MCGLSNWTCEWTNPRLSRQNRVTLFLMACCKALKFAIDASFMEIILEGDNALVMQTVSQAQPKLSRLGLIYEDIWYLAVGFRSILTNCVRRTANSVAHALATFARLIDDEIVGGTTLSGSSKKACKTYPRMV